jgi:Fe-S-cluster containining protein
MSDAFPCNGCGACCKSVRLAPETAWLDRGDGVCTHFDMASARCAIYEQRPDVCNVRGMYERHYRAGMEWPAFVELNLAACEQLRRIITERTDNV